MDVNEDEPAKWTWRPKPTCLKKTCGSLDREHKLNSWKRPPESPDGTQERLKVECYHNGVHGSTWWPDPQLHHIWLWTRLAGHYQIARRRFRHFRLQGRQQAGVHGLLPGQVLRPESFEKDRFQVRNMSEKETDYVSLVYISLFNVVKCREDETTHFEFRVQPSKDTTMQIELFFNCKLLDHGSRLKMTNDFAFFSLDSSDVYARYQCGYHLPGKQRCRRSLHHHHSLLRGQRGSQRRNSTPRRRSRLEQIKRFEDFLLLSSGRPNADEGGNAPVFTSQFQNVTSPEGLTTQKMFVHLPKLRKFYANYANFTQITQIYANFFCVRTPKFWVVNPSTSPICSRVILPTLKPRSVRDQTMTVASFLMASFSSSAIANALFTHSVWSFWKLSAPNSKIPTFTLIGTVLHLFHFSNTKTVIIYLKISDGQG